MTENELLTAVTDALTTFRWRWTHSRRSDKALTMGHPGVPDIIAVRRGRLLLIELKTEKGQLTEDQWAWLLEAEPKTHERSWLVIRPRDLDDAIKGFR